MSVFCLVDLRFFYLMEYIYTLSGGMCVLFHNKCVSSYTYEPQ